MNTPLQRLYKAKLVLLASWSAVVGVALLFLARWAANGAHGTWLAVLPLGEVGATLFGTGLIVVAWTYIDKKDGDARSREQFRQVLHEEAPAIRDAVVEGFAHNAEALANVTSPQMLDSITRNALGLQLGDQELADDLYADIRTQVIRSPERWHDVRIAVDMIHWGGSGQSELPPMFEASVRYEYRVRLSTPTMRFAATSDPQEYRELLRDPATTKAWYFPVTGRMDASAREIFELVQLAVDGRDLPVRRSQRKGAQVYSATLPVSAPSQDDQEAVVAYTYRVLVPRDNHLLYLDIGKPAKGIQIDFRYAGTGIGYVHVLDFFSGASEPRITRSAASVPVPTVEVDFDGWLFPRAGVAFVWNTRSTKGL